jgi:hypothetical protein
MIITCYNTKLARGISSNVNVNNIAYICHNSEMKIRVFEHNMGSLAKRMTKNDIRTALQALNKKGNNNSKNADNPLHIPDDDGLPNLSTWVEISLKSECLMKQIVDDFLKSYCNAYMK